MFSCTVQEQRECELIGEGLDLGEDSVCYKFSVVEKGLYKFMPCDHMFHTNSSKTLDSSRLPLT